MKRSALISCIAITVSCSTPESDTNKPKRVILETSMGKIVIELFYDQAPQTCENFIKLTKDGFFDGLTFHRVVKGHVIQSGCPKGDGTGGPGYNIKAEFNNIKHEPGIVGMARDEDPDSAGSQFYICLAPRPHLDGKYTVFGKVTEGMDVVYRIGSVSVDEIWEGKIAMHRPKERIYIKKATVQ